MSVSVQPHEFVPLKRFRNRGRCRVCMMHEKHHLPGKLLPDWPKARAWGDNSEPLSWTELFC